MQKDTGRGSDLRLKPSAAPSPPSPAKYTPAAAILNKHSTGNSFTFLDSFYRAIHLAVCPYSADSPDNSFPE